MTDGGRNDDREAQARRLGQRAAVVWLTGRPGAGKSTVASVVESELHRLGRHSCLLDGDLVRGGLCSDLGFSAADRDENIRRIGEVAKLMVGAGLIVIVSFISPFRAGRATARALFEPDEFFEVYLDTPLEVAEARDPKRMYARARRGELRDFTGIDSPYEPPESPEVRLDTVALTPLECATMVIEALERRGRLGV
jgi:bifunctional enzyme CysN/CysC